MRKYDFFWQTNKEWWYRDENLYPRLKEDAPKEAQESYKHYLQQQEEDEERHQQLIQELKEAGLL